MNILILQGSPRANGNTAWMAEEYRKAAEAAGHKVTLVDVAHKKIAGCMACEYCHGKGNGAIAASSTTGASRIAIAFRELEIDVDDSEARVDGWIDYSGTDAA